MSGGNNNATIAYPGPEWAMLWPYGFDNFQLDIVGFLAVLGEGSVLANAQVSALSRLFYLPRLIPAPQALLPARRPTALPPITASVTAVHSGNVKDHVHHVAHILLGEGFPTFTVRCVRITKNVHQERATRMDTFFRGQPVRAKTQSPTMGPPLVKAKASGPLSWVTLLGFMLSLSLLISSFVFGDGMSLIATVLLSLLSTLIGVANKWNLKLPQRPKGVMTTDGDVVIRYPNGSYLVVRCEEDVARELFFAPEEIEYNIKSPAVYRIISLVATLMLMLGVIALANARLELQFAWAGAYIVINAAHWIVAALPAELHWDLSCYTITEEGFADGSKNPTFTEALWKALILTKSKRWIKNGKAAPQTDVWDAWLVEAEEKAKTIGKSVGPLRDPNPSWSSDRNTEKATIWDVPKDWDAKKAWNTLNDEFENTGNDGNAKPGMRAV